MYNYTYDVRLDNSFFDDLGDPGDPNDELNTRAKRAYDSYLRKPLVPHEDTHLALKVLSQFGLVVHMVDPTTSFAHTLVRNIKASHNESKAELLIHRPLSSEPRRITIKVPRSSYLVLQKLAEDLGICIYLFSSRCKPHCYSHNQPRSTIALFHHVDSYLVHGEYLVLGSSAHILSPPNPIQGSVSGGEDSTYTAAVLHPQTPQKGLKRKFNVVDKSMLDLNTCQGFVSDAWYVFSLLYYYLMLMYRNISD